LLRRNSSISAEELIRACAQSNDAAIWDEFVSRFHKPISISVVRTAQQWGGASQSTVEDLIQETYIKLCANQCSLLLNFATQHPEAIVGYIKTTAVNVAHDHFKALRSQKRGLGEAAQAIEDIDPESRTLDLGSRDSIEREVLLKEIDRVLESCLKGPDRERDTLIFWLHYQQGMSAKSIATLPTITLSSKGVESVIYKLTRLIREELVLLQSHGSVSTATDGEGFCPA
jgi:RNA polymerase sigma-70 factor (ECF subfamily)